MSSVLPPSFLNYPEKNDDRPLSIAQQMKEAGALAEASQGDPIHKKKAPDRATDRRICMEERYNPMKSAEIATEHNYNMLDGVLNNQAPPPEEKELDKVKEPPHKCRSREREER